jgi:1-deoxy-D-xylulose-5-phosphate reductoisomerase
MLNNNLLKMKKSVSILGSTGSIGLHSLKIFDIKKSFFNINLLMANKNYNLICQQIKKFKPNVFVISDEKIYTKVKNKFKKNNTLIINTINLKKKFIKKSNITIAAIPGIAGLAPTIEMIKSTKKILIANKESIICGWNLIKKTALKNKTQIIPVDSEHFSIMKLLKEHKKNDVKKIYLTASGGPFLNLRLSKLKKVTPIEAIRHPKWKMGKKISIDSATLMNKLLESIEAQKLFSLNEKEIEIVIHPESLIHAIVELKNGLYKCIYHETTMIIPLANAIFERDLEITDFIKPKLNNKKSFFFQKLNFFNVDKKKFPIIQLKSRINEYNSTPIIINAANEILVDQYLKKKIPFNSFYEYLLMVMKDRNYRKYAIKEPKNINEIFQIDAWSRRTTYSKLKLNKNV